jgi:tight adherence protein C
MSHDPTNWTSLLVALAVVLAAVAAGTLLAGLLAKGTQNELERRFVRLVRGLTTEAVETGGGLRGSLVRLGTAWSSVVADREAAVLLAQGGWRGREAAALFAALRLLAPFVCGVAIGVVGILLRGGASRPALTGLLVLAGAVLGYLAPKLVLRASARNRMRRLRDEMVPLAHLMRVLYEVGLSSKQVVQVLGTAAHRVLPEAARELAEMSRLVAAGRGLVEASRDVTASLELSDLSDLFAVVRQVERQGGSVREPLLDYAALVEDRERTRLHEAVSRLSAKLTIVMVLFLMPALLVFVGGPGYMAIIRALRGGIGE